MKTRRLGKSGLEVSRIGLGLAALGRPGYINLGHSSDLGDDTKVKSLEAQTHRVLDAAWQAGVRYFDAARSYGRAEQFLASWLSFRNIPPEAVTVGSKWGYIYTAGWRTNAEKHEVKEHSLAVLQRQIGESRALLGHQLDLYQIHSATLESGVLANRAVLAELARLRATGLRIGLSVSGHRQSETLRKALAVSVDGEPLFDAVQATWNLLETSAGQVLADAHERGLGVIVKEALANGRLTARNDDPGFRERLGLLREMADQLNTTIDALALAGVLAQPWADVVLSGAATVRHLHSNLLASEVVWTEETADQLQSLVEPSEQYWDIRSQLVWN